MASSELSISDAEASLYSCEGIAETVDHLFEESDIAAHAIMELIRLACLQPSLAQKKSSKPALQIPDGSV